MFVWEFWNEEFKSVLTQQSSLDSSLICKVDNYFLYKSTNYLHKFLFAYKNKGYNTKPLKYNKSNFYNTVYTVYKNTIFMNNVVKIQLIP